MMINRRIVPVAAFFKKRSSDPIEAEIAALQQRREDLQRKRSNAEQRLTRAIEARRTALVDGLDRQDDQSDDTDKLRGEISAIDDAIAAITQRITASEEQLRQARDGAARAAAVSRLNAHANALEVAVGELDAAAARVASALEHVVHATPSVAPDFQPKIIALLHDVPVALKQFLVEARAYATNVGNGSAALYQPREPQASAPPRVIERRRTFVLQDSRWHDDGTIRTACKHSCPDVPVDLATRAVAAGIAIDPQSQHARRLVAAFPPTNSALNVTRCVDLASGGRPSSTRTEPVVPAA